MKTSAIVVTLLFAVVALLYAQASAPSIKPAVFFTSYSPIGYGFENGGVQIGNACKDSCSLMSLSLSPGSYLITGNIGVTTQADQLVTCSLSDSGGVINLPAEAVGVGPAAGIAANLSLQATATYTGTTSVTISCGEVTSGSSQYFGVGPGTLSAMPVNIK